MKNLFLVRHAKSSWAHTGLSDHGRPLADRGARDAARIFPRLRAFGPRLDHVVTSDAKRALQTTQHLAKALDLAPTQISEEPRLYHASPAKILGLARALSDRHTVIACVGHNPGFTDAANALAEELELNNLPTCGIVGIEFAVDHWVELAEGRGRVSYLDYPKLAGDPIVGAAL